MSNDQRTVDPSDMSKDELLDEIARVGNYTDREMECRKELNSRKLEGGISE